MTTHTLRFSRVTGEFAVCRLAAESDLPSWAVAERLFSITRSLQELSVICPAENVPHGVKSEAGWACFKLEGPFPFTLTGVLASFLAPLAEARIPIIAVSTFDTDYVLVKEETLASALVALENAGHEFV